VNPLYAIDGTTLDPCLSRYNWAYYRKNKGTVKLHTELDLSGNLPCFLLMSNGKKSDIRAAKENIPILPDNIYTLDKGYYDLNCFQAISSAGAFFVFRIKIMLNLSFSGSGLVPSALRGDGGTANHPQR
jgi:hypothetical protein